MIYIYIIYYRRNRIDRVGLTAIFVKMRTFVTMAQMEAKILQVCSQWKNMIKLIQLQHTVVLWPKVKTFFSPQVPALLNCHHHHLEHPKQLLCHRTELQQRRNNCSEWIAHSPGVLAMKRNVGFRNFPLTKPVDVSSQSSSKCKRHPT